MFYVYHTGEATTLSKAGDAVVWADGGNNHIGIVTRIDTTNKAITIKSANIQSVTQTYSYTIDPTTQKITISDTWPPSHWLSMKD